MWCGVDKNRSIHSLCGMLGDCFSESLQNEGVKEIVHVCAHACKGKEGGGVCHRLSMFLFLSSSRREGFV